MTFIFNNMIFPQTNNIITFLNSRLIVDFLANNFPLFVKGMLVVVVFRYQVNKISQRHAQDIIFLCDYLE